MKHFTSIVLVVGLSMAAGCAPSRSDLFQGNESSSVTGTTGRTVKSAGSSSVISAIYSSSNCSAISRGGFIWMNDSVLLADLLSPLGAENAALAVNQVNFETQGALLVDFGVMPTPDFSVKLMKDRLQLDGPKAIVQVDLVKPVANGKRKPQVVTHPCAIYVMPRVGYSTLEVQSELGDVFTSFNN